MLTGNGHRHQTVNDMRWKRVSGQAISRRTGSRVPAPLYNKEGANTTRRPSPDKEVR
jgi:hypothetical protein